MNLTISNLQKPSNKKWKAVADFLLYSLPFYLTALMVLPINEDVKIWLIFAISVLIVTIKGITKFTAEEQI